jgi:hypothetical protein
MLILTLNNGYFNIKNRLKTELGSFVLEPKKHLTK